MSASAGSRINSNYERIAYRVGPQVRTRFIKTKIAQCSFNQPAA